MNLEGIGSSMRVISLRIDGDDEVELVLYSNGLTLKKGNKEVEIQFKVFDVSFQDL